MKQLSIEELKLMRDLQENVENHAMVQALDELIAIRELKGDQVLMPAGLHPNSQHLVIGFANAMAAKLFKSEQKYGWSDAWMQDDWQDKCLAEFHRHIGKGDPLDVANYCAFMHFHGWPTALKGDQVPVGVYNHAAFCVAGSAMMFSIKEAVKAGFVSDSGELTRNHGYLFTAPQKPVVLPTAKSTWHRAGYPEDSAYERGYNAGLADSAEAIEAAGGIVKDSE